MEWVIVGLYMYWLLFLRMILSPLLIRFSYSARSEELCTLARCLVFLFRMGIRELDTNGELVTHIRMK